MRIPNRLMPHGGSVAIKPFLGDSAYGPQYGPQFTPARARVASAVSVATSGVNTSEPANVSVWFDPEVVVPLGSILTVWPGTPYEVVATVERVVYREHPGLPTHLVVSAS